VRLSHSLRDQRRPESPPGTSREDGLLGLAVNVVRQTSTIRTPLRRRSITVDATCFSLTSKGR